MNGFKFVSYPEARTLIHEGDVLLFRGRGLVSWWIKKAGEGRHTHVGLASWHRERLELVEFKEGNPLGILLGGSGTGEGHVVALSREVTKHSGRIDVFRPSAKFSKMKFNEVTKEVETEVIDFNDVAVTDALRTMTGQPYGWKTIWGFAKYNLFGLRLIYNTSRKVLDDNWVDQNLPVCSTSVAQVFRQCYIDLVPNKSDSATEPSDLARSSVLNYLFTLEDG